MRTIKASEVRKGMRIEVTYTDGEVQIVTRGPVAKVETPNTGGRVWLYLGDDYQEKVHPDHPVTVLAEPEPEWVEGAWYRLRVNGNETIAKRVEGGWVRWDADAPSWEDSDRSRSITVLGRVLIVDWPGDEDAKEIVELLDAPERAVQALANAIDAQGGVA